MKLRVATGALLWILSAGLSAGTMDEAQSLLEEGRAGEALTLIDGQLNQMPESGNWLFLRARALAELGQTGAAERVYRQLIEQHPPQIAASNNLAVLLVAQGRLKEASEVLEQALTESDPAYATLYRNLQAVNVEIARASYGKALRVEVPEQPVALKSLAQPAETRIATAEPVEQVQADPVSTTESRAASDTVSSPAIEISPTVALERDATAEIEQAVRDWARAWSDQDVGRYLSFYADDFQSDDGLSHSAWKQQRQVRLRRPQWIRIELDRLSIIEQSGGRAVVEFVQEYRSDTYGDVTRKQLVFSRDGSDWRITREKTL